MLVLKILGSSFNIYALQAQIYDTPSTDDGLCPTLCYQDLSGPWTTTRKNTQHSYLRYLY